MNVSAFVCMTFSSKAFSGAARLVSDLHTFTGATQNRLVQQLKTPALKKHTPQIRKELMNVFPDHADKT